MNYFTSLDLNILYVFVFLMYRMPVPYVVYFDAKPEARPQETQWQAPKEIGDSG